MDTRISDCEEETIDFEWFSVDRNGEIAYFGAGGRGFLPFSIMRSKENLVRLVEYFSDRLNVNGATAAPPVVPEYAKFFLPDGRDKYVAFYSGMASKGLYSFDCMDDPPRRCGYVLVARPSCPLRVEELPSALRRILEMTRFSGEFRSACEITPTQSNDFT